MGGVVKSASETGPRLLADDEALNRLSKPIFVRVRVALGKSVVKRGRICKAVYVYLYVSTKLTKYSTVCK